MKKVAWVFIVAVIAPSLILACLAFRSAIDQRVVIRDQRARICRHYATDYARLIAQIVSRHEAAFAQETRTLLTTTTPVNLASGFDERIREVWPAAEVGFSVSLQSFTCPSPATDSRPEARDFRLQNLQFLCSVNPDEVYWSPKSLSGLPTTKQEMLRQVSPKKRGQGTTAIFQDIVGEDMSGILARFLQDELNVWTWFRDDRNTSIVYGAKLDMGRLTDIFREGFERPGQASVSEFWRRHEPKYIIEDDVCLALLNDKGIPVARTHRTFETDWSQPFVASDIGETLPHWKIAVYHLNYGQFVESTAQTAGALLLLVAALIVGIGVGSWLILADLNRQLTLARQKTDFVSNVSHELKTPLTSIRMFSELLAEDRAETPEKRRKFLGIINAETARLTRLINNVLDFSRMERGEKKYEFKECDLSEIVSAVAESCRPHLEGAGFAFACETPESPVLAKVDRDALSQVILNLLSNAEKYSRKQKDVTLRLARKTSPIGHAEIQVLDRGSGVPEGGDERIFEKFHRAEDSLDSGIEGSGLGLTLARQIARAHGGDIACQPRDGGGSIFTCSLPILSEPE